MAGYFRGKEGYGGADAEISSPVLQLILTCATRNIQCEIFIKMTADWIAHVVQSHYLSLTVFKQFIPLCHINIHLLDRL